MRILWFSIVPANKKNTAGTWIESLLRIVKKWDDVSLAISFVDNEQSGKQFADGVSYYPITVKRSFLQKKIDQYTSKYTDDITIEKCIDVINDFHPDIIHVFGSEWCFGKLVSHTEVPIIIHIQGCYSVISAVGDSLRFSDTDIVKEKHFSPTFWIGHLLRKHRSHERSERETRIIKTNCHFFVRTRWDRSVIKFFNPNANLYFCNEALRTVFMNEKRRWQPHNRKTIVLTSIGTAFIKGVDLILKTAIALCSYTNLQFEWRLIGDRRVSLPVVQHKMGVHFEDVNIISIGELSSEGIVNHLLETDIYIHVSYIDNSPNAICEAQYLGLPIIATYVGGTPSMFSSNYDQTMLVGVNDEYYLASKIVELANNKELQLCLSKENSTIAALRHSDNIISEDLRNSYKKVVDSHIKNRH